MMLRRILTTMLLSTFAPAAAVAYPGEAKVLSDKALKSYEASQFEKAEELYEKAAEKAPGDPDTIKFNLGTSQIKAGKFAKAIEAYKAVFDEKSPHLNASARFNAGYAHHMLSKKALEATANAPGMEDAASAARDTAIKELELAIDDYRSAMLAAPQERDIKHNYELAWKELEELKRQKEQEQQSEQQDKQQNQDQQKQDQQQQQQQQQNDADSQQEQQQQQQQDQQKKEEEQKQQEQQQQDQQQGEQEKKDQQKKDEQKQKEQEQQPGDKPEPKATPTPTPGPKPGEEKKPEDQQQPGDSGSGDAKDQQQQQEVPIGEMSPQDVERLLNSLPDGSQEALQRFLQGDPQPQREMENDW